MVSALDKLLNIIEKQLDWGKAGSWRGRDFEKLNLLILEKTGVSLSASTLRRLWGRVSYTHLPSAVTLDTIAQFAGFKDWRTYTKESDIPLSAAVQQEIRRTGKPARTRWKAAVLCLLVAAGISGFYFLKKPAAGQEKWYAFSSRKVARGLPNSVVFDYDVSAAATDSNYIQQSWDPGTKTLVSKRHHQHTSIYYEPGFYKAKLIADRKVVKEHDLIISTEGWMAYIHQQPVPVYLDAQEFLHKDRLEFPPEKMKKDHLSARLPEITYSNVGGFDPVPLHGLQFSCEVKNSYKSGNGACQRSSILLVTNNEPILVPLSSPGCSSALDLISAGEFISGKTVDLSGFTADLSQWTRVECKVKDAEIYYLVNGKIACRLPLPSKRMDILGLSFSFEGAGAVRAVRLNHKII